VVARTFITASSGREFDGRKAPKYASIGRCFVEMEGLGIKSGRKTRNGLLEQLEQDRSGL
jgi:hypothetical protein